MDDHETLPITDSVPVFGKIAYGLERNGAYDAARPSRDGKPPVIPTIEVQGKKRVPLRPALAEIAKGDPEVLRALISDYIAKRKRLEEQAA